jgi:2-phosphosulfolactate phosphatase
VAIVVDVLRACTNLITAFSMGAKRCRVTADVSEARKLARTMDAILMGERHNQKIDGFDYGNSPVQLEQRKIGNSTIIFTSTNFPGALAAASEASNVLLGTLVNLSAVCEKAVNLAINTDADITLMLAGEPSESHAAEDYYFAGRAAHILSGSCSLDSPAQQALTAACGRSPEDIMSLSLHAQELANQGYDKDVEFAMAVDRFDIVPTFRNGWITLR